MKKLLYPLLLILVGLINDIPNAKAQNSFAPVGAEWYHNMGFGVFHSVVTGDTLLNGIACRHIAVRPMVKNPAQAPPASSLSSYDFYVYDNTDTVFIYNNLFDRFTPLYVFNVQAGDTLHLPVPPLYDCKKLLETDSQFVIVIDSVVTKNWDNVPLETVYSHPVVYQPYAYFSFGDSGYVRSLGSIATGFLPECLNCGSLLSESCQSMSTLRCYHDSNSGGISLALVDTCDNNAHTGIDVVDISAGLKIYPSPATDYVVVDLDGEVPATLKLYNLSGDLAFEIHLRPGGNTIDVRSLASGIYAAQIIQEGNPVYQQKIIKK